MYNYQVPIVGATHGDNIQGSLNNFTINAANRLSGNGGYQNTRSDDPDLFGFTDTLRSSTANATLTWNRRITQRISAVIRYQFSLSSTANRPYFANRIDVSGNAGISGNDRDPRNWGPPALNFSSGIARLSSGTYSSDRNLSHSVSYSSTWIRGRHGFTYGADYRRQQFNLYLAARPARKLHVHRLQRRKMISRTSFWAFPRPARSPTETRTSTFASRSPVASSPTIGKCGRRSP